MKWLFFQSVLENKNNSRMDVTVLITGGCGEGFRGAPLSQRDRPLVRLGVSYDCETDTCQP